MKPILVTGATGRVGREVVSQLVAEGARVRALTRNPESLTQREQVEAIGDVIGRPLHLEEISPEQARTELGFPTPVINMLLNAWAAAIGQPAFVTSTVAEVTGNPARTFREWVSDHTGEFGS